MIYATIIDTRRAAVVAFYRASMAYSATAWTD